MTNRPPTFARLLPPLLAVGGWLAILLVLGVDSWPLLLGWLAAIAAVVVATAAPRRTRLLAGIALAIVFVGLTWEGGLFFVPSALALVALPSATAEQPPQRA
jgi:hypothetical protein